MDIGRDGWIDIWRDGWINKSVVSCLYDYRMNRWLDGWMNRWADRWIDGSGNC